MVNKNKKNKINENVTIIKEKSGVAYRLNNSLFDRDTSIGNIVKNVFYKHINIVPLDDETKKIITDIQSAPSDELKNLLEINLSFHLKEFVKQSKISKAKIKVYYSKLVGMINDDYQNFKSNEEEILLLKTSEIQKRLDQIERMCSQKTEQLKGIKNEIKDKISNVSQNNILRIEERKSRTLEIQEFLEEKQKELDAKLKNSDLINEEIKNISITINELVTEKENLIVDLNNHRLNFNNKIDKEFAKKEKNIANLEIEKIEAYIWIRNSLILLNRIIRDVQIELGLRKIEVSWNKILGNFDEIKMQASRIFNDFNFFDAISDVESKIMNSKDINVNDRIVNIKPSEELVNR